MGSSIFFGVLAIIIGVIYFISTNLNVSISSRTEIMQQNNHRLELVDLELKESDNRLERFYNKLEESDNKLEESDNKLEESDKLIYQEIRNLSKELGKENQLLRERLIILEQLIK